MKKYIFLLPLMMLLFASCEDVLKEESFTEVGKDNYVENAEEAETVLLGVYRHLSTEGIYSFHLSLLFTISSDIAQCEGSGNTSFRVIPTNSHNPSTTEMATTWSELYSAIYDANDFIETVSARMGSWSE
ncbi:MAG: RagB/SusD family nutrient uptake outer membrane protein, partial [Alistipes sp.]|nr:RagB/SusD family nutrient uptake outer membrane protein [Alistipes sp.]